MLVQRPESLAEKASEMHLHVTGETTRTVFVSRTSYQICASCSILVWFVAEKCWKDRSAKSADARCSRALEAIAVTMDSSPMRQR